MLRKILPLVISTLVAFTANAQASSWPAPNKPITFINPFPPGGAVDAFGRPLAKQLSTQLNDSIVVDNRGGAGGTLGAAVAAKMAPDGYTWLQACTPTSPMTSPKILSLSPSLAAFPMSSL